VQLPLQFLDPPAVLPGLGRTRLTEAGNRILLLRVKLGRIQTLLAAPGAAGGLTTFIAALRHDQITAPMAIDRPMNGEIFLAYVLLTFLLSTLSGGDIVVMDNLADLNAIEQVFAKLKALLRNAKKNIDIYGIASANCWTNSPQRMRELSLPLGIRFNVIVNRSRAC
jgi:hypothetical protein